MPRIGRSLVFSTLLLLAPMLVGCASSYGDNPFEGSAGNDDVRITIQNQNFNDATIWAEWGGGSRTRLGTVTGNSTQTFTTRYRSEVIRFEVDFLGGRRYTTQSYPVNPGDHLDLRIRP